MMIQNGESTLKAVFDGSKVFRVPNYQRAYAWAVDPHVATLLDDLTPSARSMQRPYYLGTLLLEEEGEQDGYTRLSIVDGQQRLTSLIILMSVLMDRIESLPEATGTPAMWKLARNTFLEYEGVPKFRTVEDDDPFFRDHIIGRIEPIAFDTPSKHRLWDAKQYFMKKVSGCDARDLQVLVQRIQSSKVLVFAVTDRGEAAQIFELNNDRGKSLTQLEAVKSFSMHQVFMNAGSAQRDVALRTIQQRFAEIYRRLEQIEAADPRSEREDAILRYHWIAFEEWTVLEQPKELFKKKVRTLDEDAVVNWVDQFSARLKRSFEIVATLLSRRDEIEMLGDLYALGRMGNLWPLVIKVYDWDPDPGKEQFKRVLRLLEMFSFRAYGIANVKSDAGRSFLYGAAHDFRGGFTELIAELKKACTERWDVGKKFEAGLGSARMYEEGADARYLLWRYENHLRRRSGRGYPKITWSAFLSGDAREKLSIEHIAAQKADPVPSSKVLLEGDDETFRRDFLHALGNLVIDSASPNASKGKDPFLKKEAVYQGSPFMSQQELSAFAREAGRSEAPIWDKEVIQGRGEVLRKFALDEWDPERV